MTAQSAQKVAETEQQRADAQARKASESQQHSRRLLYAADMNLAQQTLKLNNLGRARRLLDRHRPQPGEEDLRGWEWRYLWQLTRSSALATLTNRTAKGYALSFSPDGSRLAVGWDDAHVDLWDVPSRQWVRALTDRESRGPGGREAVKLWDVGIRQELLTLAGSRFKSFRPPEGRTPYQPRFMESPLGIFAVHWDHEPRTS